MGRFIYQLGLGCYFGSRRYRLLASAAVVVAATVAVGAKAEEVDGRLEQEINGLSIASDNFYGGDWQGENAIAVHHSGMLLSNAAGLDETAEADTFLREEQDTAQGILGIALGASVAEDANSLLSQKIVQKNDASQKSSGGKWGGAGSVDLDNLGSIQADGTGIRARGRALVAEESSQALAQGNASLQLGLSIAHSADPSKASSIAEGAQELSQTNSGSQIADEIAALGAGAVGAGAVTVNNGGEIVAGGHGIRAGSRVVRVTHADQASAQGNLALQADASAAHAFASEEAKADGEGKQSSDQRNWAGQTAAGAALHSAGAVAVTNSGSIEAARDGISGQSNVIHARLAHQGLFQGNATVQAGLTGALALGAEANAVALGAQSLDQENQAEQIAAGSVATGVGVLEIHNSGDIRSGRDAVDAHSRVTLYSNADQYLAQGNAALQLGAAVALSGAGSSEEARGEAAQEFLQSNTARQEVSASDWSGAGSVAVRNSGRITAGGSGVEAGSRFSASETVRQELSQDNSALQLGLAVGVALDDGAGASARGAQELVQRNDARQMAGGGTSHSVGVVAVENSGDIQADADGVAADSSVRLSSWTVQKLEQWNEADQLGAAAAIQQVDGKSPSAEGRQGIEQSNNSGQHAYGTSAEHAGSITVRNSGGLLAEGDGIYARSSVRIRDGAVQGLMQHNGVSVQGGLAAAVPLNDSDTPHVAGGQSHEQENRGVQAFGGSTATSAGAIAVDNSGAIRSGGDGIYALGDVSLSANSRQFMLQENHGWQLGALLPSHGYQPAQGGEQEWQSSNEARQVAVVGSAASAGSALVTNSGSIAASEDGIYAAGWAKFKGASRQLIESFDAPDSQITASQHYSEGDRSFAGAAEVMNQGDIEAGWGIIAWGDASGRSRVQQVHTGSSAGSVGQDAEGADWAGAGAATVRNSGNIKAESGMDAWTDLHLHMSAAQFIGSATSASQLAKLDVGDNAGAAALYNSGNISAAEDGVYGWSILGIDMSVEQSIGSAPTASQRVELNVGENAGAVEIVNSGEVLAGAEGLYAEAEADISLDVEQKGADALREVLVELGPGLARASAHNTPEGVVVVENGKGIVARSRLNLELPEAADVDMASGPRVRVLNDGLIIASTGISASSTSGPAAEDVEPNPGGDIQVVVGESGVVLALQGPAVEILDGADNKMINDGLLVSHGEWTVTGGSQNESIINRGMLSGSVDLGGGQNAFLNEVGGIFDPGAWVRLGGGELRNRGILWPGFEEIQHTTLEGDLYLEDGSLYIVDIRSAGASDHISVEGSVTIEEKAVLVVERAQDEYPLHMDYSILSSTEAIDGTFNLVEPGLPFLDLLVSPDKERRQLNLHVGRSGASFDSVARSRNQRSVGRALESVGPGEDGSLYRQVVWMTEEEAREAYDSLSGEAHATAQSMPADIGRRLRGQLLKRMSGFSGGSSSGGLEANSLASLAVSDAEPVPVPAAEDSATGPAAWVEVYAGTGTLDGDGNAAETRTTSWGGLIGAEMLFSEQFGMGLAVGYQDDRLKIDDRLSRVEVDTYSLSAYGLWRSGAWRVRGGAGFGWHDFESERTVRLPSGDRRAEADYDGWSAQAFAEVGHRFQLEDVAIEPFVGLTFQHSRTESYAEKGAGDANLDVGKDRNSMLYSTLGIQVSETFELEGDLRLRPFVSLGWEHRLTGSSGDANLAFAAGGSRFTVSGPKQSKDAALIGVGLDIGIGKGIEVFGAYDAYISSRQHDQTARAGVRLKF